MAETNTIRKRKIERLAFAVSIVATVIYGVALITILHAGL